jgi:GntR family transcriptional regulator, transcriptional repressor for pyruvate dehydrogenase complex
MPKDNFLENIKEIESPVDIIIKQIKNLISQGELMPGSKLPPERKLAEKFGVGRSYVREAIKKLEFYGILKTLPQSGTLVAGMGIAALEGLISDVLKLHEDDFSSLVETRYILELQSARFAALRRTHEDIIRLEEAFDAYETEVLLGNQALDQDLMFHLKIAEAGKNDVLKSLMMIITPDLLRNYASKDVCGDGRFYKSLEEHRAILKAIKEGNEQQAEDSMAQHLSDILNAK